MRGDEHDEVEHVGQPPEEAPPRADLPPPEEVLPLDGADPRFGLTPDQLPPRLRELVPSQGPGSSELDPLARILRTAIPLLVLAGLLAVAAVFWAGLAPSSGVLVVGDEDTVRAAVSGRPHRVCLSQSPCAWLTVVDGDLLALSTSGPLREEFGPSGVSWCPTSGYFGSNSLGSRFDPAGRVVRGPAPRGLDRYDLSVDRQGRLRVHFLSVTTGLQVARVGEVIPPVGPHCEGEIPFDRDADLRL